MRAHNPENARVRARGIVIFLSALLLAGFAWGRGGGGCLEEGTQILTPTGAAAVEQLAPGDTVWAVVGGQLQPATVQARSEVEPVEYVEISVAGKRLRATPEHPLQVGLGTFRLASVLRAGDPLYFSERGDLKALPIDAVTRVKAVRPAFNLLVAPGGTYLANNIVAHNKGCFLPDTPILRADGTQSPIHEIRPGDELLAFTLDGEVVRATVRRVIALEVDEYVVVRTEKLILHVTREHPFYVGQGTFKTLEALKLGDRIYAVADGALREQRITSLEVVRAPTRVYNLQTDRPNTFFANGVAVHNKGGGCFPAGTRIRTPNGETAIEKLQPGDAVRGVDERGAARETVVEAVQSARSPLLLVKTDRGTLRTTAEHPLLSAGGAFRPAGEFRPGESILTWDNGQLCTTTIRKLTTMKDEEEVFNLRVGAPHTFIAEGFVVHNKGGGCFPAGTAVLTERGETPVEQLTLGNVVMAIAEDGSIQPAHVAGILSTVSPLLILKTDCGTLRTTTGHPLRLAGGGFRAAGDLCLGDVILVYRDGQFQRAKVLSQRLSTEETEVFNLRVGWPHTFVANGFVVHNKGGGGFHGGGGYHSSGGGSGDPTAGLIVVLIIIGAFVTLVIIKNAAQKGKSDEDLDYLYSRSDVQPKAEKTRKLLEFLARVDQSVSPEKLAAQAQSTFLQLQKCWPARNYEPMKSLMMPDLYADHCAQLSGMVRNHEINVIADLRVARVDIVNVRYTQKEDDREFTALITASARDYYVDDRTQKFLRGDEEPAAFQEFWTFQRQNGAWLLREIEQTRESDALKEENFFEQFTDVGVEQVYGEAAGRAGPAGPWLEKETLSKATRVERLLNFLVQTDTLWDRQALLERARQVFLHVMLAREKGDPASVPTAELFPDVIASLQGELVRLGAQGTQLEFRNLCVRKVELILVRNFADNSRDEFTVRISAHAQRAVRRNNLLISQDQYVTPFVEFWTFSRLDNEWKLKEVLPPARGEGLVGMENVDEDSSPEQLQWYYQQTRAV